MPIDNFDDVTHLGQDDTSSVYAEDKDIYNKKIVSKPLPEKEIGIDTKDSFLDDVVTAATSNQLDTAALEQFTRVSQGRDSIYALIDTMCEDSMIAAVLETYTEDSTEKSDSGSIMWAESNDPDTAKYINYLLDSMGVDKNIFKWTNYLCKYGDVYLRLYRQSDYEEDILAEDVKDKKGLQEDININAYKDNDHYVHYLEMMPNPAEVFELTKFGKSYAYIIAPVMTPSQQATNKDIYQQQLNPYRFQFTKRDIDVYGPADFVHGCLEDNSSRTPEYVSIFRNEEDKAENKNAYTYTVKRGQSLFYNVFKVWRELSLLQNSILLNRVTKSSIVRTISVEVGDMPKENVGPHLQWIKQLFEQKSALDADVSMNEYTNPGPVENNVYIPTRQGQGALTVGQVGGDVNVGQLTDLDYFRDLLFGALRIPKQYFGFTEDGAGFNGGQSLSIISSRYAKMVKRIQATMCQLITDAINLLLIDKGLSRYINEFTLHMVPPTTQEEIDRRDNTSSKIRLVSDVMSNLNDIEDPLTRLKILKSMLSEALPNTEVAELIQDEIEKIEKGEEEGVDADLEGAVDLGGEEGLGLGDEGGFEEPEDIDLAGDLGLEEPAGGPEGGPEPEVEEEPRGNLPSPEELGAGDFTDNNMF